MKPEFVEQLKSFNCLPQIKSKSNRLKKLEKSKVIKPSVFNYSNMSNKDKTKLRKNALKSKVNNILSELNNNIA